MAHQMILFDYNWLIFPVNLQHYRFGDKQVADYNWLIFPVNLQQTLCNHVLTHKL